MRSLAVLVAVLVLQAKSRTRENKGESGLQPMSARVSFGSAVGVARRLKAAFV